MSSTSQDFKSSKPTGTSNSSSVKKLTPNFVKRGTGFKSPKPTGTGTSNSSSVKKLTPNYVKRGTGLSLTSPTIFRSQNKLQGKFVAIKVSTHTNCLVQRPVLTIFKKTAV
jgi:hypothetical protein